MQYHLKNILTDVVHNSRDLARLLNIKLHVPEFDNLDIIVKGDPERHNYFLNTCFSTAIQCAFINSIVHVAFFNNANLFRLDISFRSILDKDKFILDVFNQLKNTTPDGLTFNSYIDNDNPLTLSLSFPMSALST